MTSSRLPGKALVDICGVSNLKRMLDRVKKARHSGLICIATTKNITDDPIEEFGKREAVEVFRGDEQDVLGRVFGAAKFFGAKNLIRLTADCPMIDPVLIDEVYEIYTSGSYDYAANGNTRSFPDGLDVEVFSFDALEKAHQEAIHPFLREHVTPYIRGSHPQFGCGEFKIKNVVCPWNFGHIRWTLDTPYDLKIIRELIGHLPSEYSWMDALAVATKYPHLLGIKN
jgi:spore coat polysaccharide biosynthesis protein SpsF (cytidylyltransferase family)